MSARRPIWLPFVGWHPQYPAGCVACGTDRRPHLSAGLCHECYRAAHRLGERGHEAVPVYRPTSRDVRPPAPPTAAERSTDA